MTINVICHQCSHSVPVDTNNVLTYCPYCGQGMLYSAQDVTSIVAAQNSAARAQQRTQRTAQAMAYKDRKDKRDNAMMLFLFAVALILIFVPTIILNINSENEKNEQERIEQEHLAKSEIKLSISADDLKGKNYEDVVLIFESAGFTNIDIVPEEDLVFGWLTEDGEVESVTINGSDDFSSGDWYHKEAVIKIIYHTFMSSD